jgi:hypothetical protein
MGDMVVNVQRVEYVRQIVKFSHLSFQTSDRTMYIHISYHHNDRCGSILSLYYQTGISLMEYLFTYKNLHLRNFIASVLHYIHDLFPECDYVDVDDKLSFHTLYPRPQYYYLSLLTLVFFQTTWFEHYCSAKAVNISKWDKDLKVFEEKPYFPSVVSHMYDMSLTGDVCDMLSAIYDTCSTYGEFCRKFSKKSKIMMALPCLLGYVYDKCFNYDRTYRIQLKDIVGLGTVSDVRHGLEMPRGGITNDIYRDGNAENVMVMNEMIGTTVLTWADVEDMET